MKNFIITSCHNGSIGFISTEIKAECFRVGTKQVRFMVAEKNVAVFCIDKLISVVDKEHFVDPHDGPEGQFVS